MAILVERRRGESIPEACDRIAGELLQEHLGPGDHPSGSSQAVHAPDVSASGGSSPRSRKTIRTKLIRGREYAIINLKKDSTIFGAQVDFNDEEKEITVRWNPAGGFTRHLAKIKYMRALDEHFSPLKADEFIRVHFDKNDYEHLQKGTHRGSINHATGEEEGGLSVSKAPEFPNTYAYTVKGVVVGEGSDGEPLLDTDTVKPVSKLSDFETYRDDFLRKQEQHVRELGWTLTEFRKIQSSFILEDVELKEHLGPGPHPSGSPQAVHARKNLVSSIRDANKEINKEGGFDKMDRTLSRIDLGASPEAAILDIVSQRTLTHGELTTLDLIAMRGLNREQRREYRNSPAREAIKAEQERLVQLRTESLKGKTFFEVTQFLDTPEPELFHAARRAIEEMIPTELKRLEVSKAENAFADRNLDGRFDKDITKKVRRSGTVEQEDLLVEVAQTLPRRAAERVDERLKTVKFYDTEQALTESVVEEFGARLQEGEFIGGVYLSTTVNKKPVFSELRLNQDFGTGENINTFTREEARGIYAHELAHVYDRRNDGTRISKSPFWQAAYDVEIKFGQLTRYAKTSPEEGFAEYGRLVSNNPEKAIRDFPRSWAVYSGNNL